MGEGTPRRCTTIAAGEFNVIVLELVAVSISSVISDSLGFSRGVIYDSGPTEHAVVEGGEGPLAHSFEVRHAKISS